MERSKKWIRAGVVILTSTFALLPSACSEDDGGDSEHRALDGGGDGGLHEERPVYAIQWMVLGDEESTTYIQLTDTLDVEPSLDDAREFGGWVSMAAVGGRLLVSDSDAPRLRSFSVDGLEWNDEKTLNFANTGAQSADFGGIWLLNEHVAYLLMETTSRVVFDPSELEILDIKEDTNLELMRDDGMALGASYQRQARIPTIDHVMVPFSYYKDLTYPGPSIIASYDPETHEEAKLTEVDCEGLELASQDEDGNTYYSPWYSWQLGFLYGMADPACVVRIKPDGTVDEGWPKDFLDVTGGRPVASWQYLEDGKAVATVLHSDEIDVDFTGEFDESLELGPYYTWIFDTETGEAHKIDDIPASGWAFQVARLDGRLFLFIPDPNWESTTAYEIDSQTGAIEPAFTAEGWIYNMVRVN